MDIDRAALVIRSVQDADMPELTRLINTAYTPLAQAGMNFTAADQDEAVTRARVRDQHCWVVTSDDLLVGTATLSYPPSDPLQMLTVEAQVPKRGWLNQFAVLPQVQGQGIGRLLWNHCVETATDLGLKAIGVDTAIPAQELIELYGRWGFVQCDKIHWPGKTYDSVVLVKTLSDP